MVLTIEILVKVEILDPFGTVAGFAFFESLDSPLLCGPPLLGQSSVALRLEKKRSPLSSQRCLPSDCPDLKKKKWGVISGRAIFALISEKNVSASESRFLSILQ